MLAVTGLILFHDEIDHALGVVPGASPGAASITLADAVELARDGRPGEAVFAFREPDDHPGVVFIGLAEGSRRLEDAEPVAVDLIRGVVLDEVDVTSSFIELVLELHAELFAGPWGRLLVGVVAFALLVSLVSGAIVYGPIMRRFAFGLIRRGGALRTTVADLHKLIGITTLGWSAVVAVTGLMLSLGSVLLQVYSMTELAALGAPYAHEPIVTDVTSIDRAVRSAEASSEGRTWTVVALPGSDLASPRHYTILLQGGKGLDARLLTMAMVDATAPESAADHPLPWYLRALLVSEPLHFGDYGGWPLKVVWAFFGVLLTALSLTGLRTFFKPRRNPRRAPPPAPVPAAGE